MTDREKAIVMAYTGICMLSGDKFNIFHKYVEDIMGRPVYTHEMAIKAVDNEIKEKSKADFIALCAEQEPKTGHWKSFTHSAYHGIDDDGEPIWREVKVYHCNLCDRRTVIKENYCPNCGARMVEPQESEDENANNN